MPCVRSLLLRIRRGNRSVVFLIDHRLSALSLLACVPTRPALGQSVYHNTAYSSLNQEMPNACVSLSMVFLDPEFNASLPLLCLSTWASRCCPARSLNHSDPSSCPVYGSGVLASVLLQESGQSLSYLQISRGTFSSLVLVRRSVLHPRIHLPLSAVVAQKCLFQLPIEEVDGRIGSPWRNESESFLSV